MLKEKKIKSVLKHLFTKGTSPKDLRGTHTNRPNKVPDDTLGLVENHVRSFKSRQSHYSRRKNPNTYYLPETLNVKKNVSYIPG